MNKELSDAKRAYESRRAAKAGMSLEKWLDRKEKEKLVASRTREASAMKSAPKKPGLFSRLLEKAQKPL